MDNGNDPKTCEGPTQDAAKMSVVSVKCANGDSETDKEDQKVAVAAASVPLQESKISTGRDEESSSSSSASGAEKNDEAIESDDENSSSSEEEEEEETKNADGRRVVERAEDFDAKPAAAVSKVASLPKKTTNNDSDHEEEVSSSDDSTEEKNDKARGSGEDSSSSSEDEDDAKPPSTNDTDAEDGRGLSKYELLRLERIKRNREYLSQLGLTDENLLKAPARKKRKKKPVAPASPGPKRSSGRVRKSINYAEPSNSVANLLRAPNSTPKPKPPPKEPKEKKEPKTPHHRMERFIFREFQRLKSLKTQTLRDADRHVRLADKELIYWKRRLDSWNYQEERRKLQEETRADFGCGNLKDLLRSVDKRMPELLSAASRYDAEYEAAGRAQEREAKRLENEQRMKLLGALNMFPKALKSSASLLRDVLVARAPDDPPPPRRSRRSDPVEAPPPAKKRGRKATAKRQQIAVLEPDTDEWFGSSEDPGSCGVEDSLFSSSKYACFESRTALGERSAKNVGGWISPGFSEALDRSWLENDRPVMELDPSRYVPQAGDIVLYYPTGHQIHLKHYPDVLGEKTRDPSRVPLWERAFAEKENLNDNEHSYESKPWWNEKWLNGIKEKAGAYPIICRVQSTQAEFPPDPYTKTEEKDDEGNILKVTWRPPKDPGVLRRTAGTPLRLAIELSPLTSVLPPNWTEAGPQDVCHLSPPPDFTVVTFPNKLKPFVVPFVWAYSAAHSFSVDDKVSSILDPGTGKVQVRGLSALNEEVGSMRLDDKLPFLHTLANRLEDPAATRKSLEEDLSKYEKKLPMRDMRAISSILKDFLRCHENLEYPEECPAVNIVDLVRSTLPLYDSVTTMTNAYNRAKIFFSPWELVPHRKGRRSLSSFRPFGLEDGLRDMVEFVIEDVLSEDASAGLFEYPVDEEDAPSYDCAVPLNMSLSRILTRLKSSRVGDHRCYYRDIDSVLEDIEIIVGNCLLYNSPDSPVVEAAVGVVDRLQQCVKRSAQSRYEELLTARKTDEERKQRLLLRQPSVEEDDDERATVAHSIIQTLKAPFRGTPFRSWLLPPSTINAAKEVVDWIPQAGDSVLYSEKRHAQFVDYHRACLRAEHCDVLGEPEGGTLRNGSRDNGGWLAAKVLWTELVYPRPHHKATAHDANSFTTDSMLLALHLELQPTHTTGLVFWRPCIFVADLLSDGSPSCSCGLSHGESFIVPDGTESESCTEVATISADCSDMLHQLFSLLKRKCLRNEPIASVEPELTNKSIKQGYKPTQIRGKLRNLPTYDHLIGMDSYHDENVNAVTTRGVPRKSLLKDPARDRLSECGFLPSWSKAVASREDVDLDKYATATPVPESSLELVQMRLRRGYYRHIASIENDIVESFVTSIVLLVRELPGRKKISLKRVARGLLPGSTEGDPIHDLPAHIAEEEARLVQRLRPLWDLYAVALMITSYGAQLRGIYGLLDPLEKTANSLRTADPEQDPQRAEARAKLSHLLSAVGRDKSHRTKHSLPTMKVRLKCGGVDISCTKEVIVVDHCIADWNGETVNVKFTSGGSVIPYHKEVNRNRDDGPPKQETKEVVETCITADQADFEGSDSLSQFFFGLPCRREPCARCKVYHRSFLACRVKRGHANADFDWLDVFKGVGGLDGLLNTLFPKSSAANTSQGTTEPLPTDANNGGNEGKGERAQDASEDKNAQEEENNVDPREFAAKAEECLQLAKRLHGQAAVYVDAPVRLEKDFIKKAMPIDPSDDHYVYCVVCGLSGDLICCDGCANVVHSDCINLKEVPDDEWFCEECELAGRSTQKKGPSHSEEPSKGSKELEEEPQCTLPFGRVEFDHEKAEELASTLDFLKSSRPQRQKRSKDDDDDDASESEEEVEPSDDESSVDVVLTRSRRRTRNSSAVDESGNEKSNRLKKERKRPQVNSTTVEAAKTSRHRGKKRGKRHEEGAANVVDADVDDPPKVSKRPRGRPRKKPEAHGLSENDDSTKVARRPRGRPRKKPAADDGSDTDNSPKAVRRPRGRLRKKPAADDGSDSEDLPKAASRPRGKSCRKPAASDALKEAKSPARRGRPRKSQSAKSNARVPSSEAKGQLKKSRGVRGRVHVSSSSRRGDPAPPEHSSKRSGRPRKSPKRYQDTIMSTQPATNLKRQRQSEEVSSPTFKKRRRANNKAAESPSASPSQHAKPEAQGRASRRRINSCSSVRTKKSRPYRAKSFVQDLDIVPPPK